MTPPVPHIELLAQLEADRTNDIPASREDLRHLRDSVAMMRTDPNFPALQARVNAVLEHADGHFTTGVEVRKEIGDLRAQINAFPIAPAQPAGPPEFARSPDYQPPQLNPGLRSPYLGAAFAATTAVVGGSLLWNLFTKPVETLKNVGKTVLAVGAVAGAWFGLRNVNWREVWSSVRGGAGSAWDGVSTGAVDTWDTVGSFIYSYSPAWLARHLPERWSPDGQAKLKAQAQQNAQGQNPAITNQGEAKAGAVAPGQAPPGQVKQNVDKIGAEQASVKGEVDGIPAGQVKAKAAENSAQFSAKVKGQAQAEKEAVAEKLTVQQKIEADRKAVVEKFRQEAEKNIRPNVNLIGERITIRPGLTVQVALAPPFENPVLVINGVRWRVVPTGLANARFHRITYISRSGDGTYTIAGENYNRNLFMPNEEAGTSHVNAGATYRQLFDGLEAVVAAPGPEYIIPTPQLGVLATLGGFKLRREN